MLRHVAPLLFAGLTVTALGQGPVTAVLKDASGNDAGTVVFRQTGSVASLDVRLDSVSAGWHAIHIHEGGECVGPDFASAKGHLNPNAKHHGFGNPDGHHVGDFHEDVGGRNNGVGRAHSMVTSQDITLVPGQPNSIYGHTVVIHELRDDGKSDPSGASGKRIFCGVIPAAM